jgi:hypothetical protein
MITYGSLNFPWPISAIFLDWFQEGLPHSQILIIISNLKAEISFNRELRKKKHV